MANTSLPNLTERTATANTDLIHVNSGGTDYKETKGNFLSDVNSSINSLNNSFANRFVNLGSISATSLKTALIAAFNNLSVHDNPVIGTYSYSGAWMFWAHKYTGDQYGMMLAITYYPSDTSILLLNRSNGVDTVRAVNLSGAI